MTNKIVLNGIDLADALWAPNRTDQFYAQTILRIDRRLASIEPTTNVDFAGPALISGIQWQLVVTDDGKGVGNWYAGWPPGAIRWNLALSFRGPYITALSWSQQGQPEDPIPDPNLVTLVQSMAQDLNLTYLDAHALRSLEIPWDELQGDAHMRLDWSEMPTAFNLLFYEY